MLQRARSIGCAACLALVGAAAASCLSLAAYAYAAILVLQVLDSQPVPALRPGRLAEVAQLDSSTSDAAQCMAVRIS